MRFAKHAAIRLLSARLKKPRRAIPVLRREFGGKSMRIEKRNKTKHGQEQADAARNLAASAVTNNIAEGLSWYRKAVALDPDNMAGWLGLRRRRAGRWNPSRKPTRHFTDTLSLRVGQGTSARLRSG